MNRLINFIQKNQENIHKILDFSIHFNREIAGYYKISQNNTKLCKKLFMGKYDCVNPDHISQLDKIPFHTHILKNNPPSSNDITDLIYQSFTTGNDTSFVISPEGTYIYKISDYLKSNIKKNLHNIEIMSNVKNIIEKEIDNIALNIHNGQKQIEDYIYIAKCLGIDVVFIYHNSELTEPDLQR
jgi:hypothetical protein